MRYDHETFGYSNGWVDFEDFCSSKCVDEEFCKKENGEVIRQTYTKDNLVILVVARKMCFEWSEWRFTYCVKENQNTIHLGNDLNNLLTFIDNYEFIHTDREF